jgi:HPt (histidine-containing phosphotransfer) domain-containing protein
LTNAVPAEELDLQALPVVDMDHLASFTDGDTDLESELADLFVSTALGYLKRMDQAIEEERSWSAEVHALKGASANLGARRLAALAKVMEFSPPSKDGLEALRSEFEDVRAFFTNRR